MKIFSATLDLLGRAGAETAGAFRVVVSTATHWTVRTGARFV